MFFAIYINLVFVYNVSKLQHQYKGSKVINGTGLYLSRTNILSCYECESRKSSLAN